jgi:phosphatidylethanolamine-binding protein (PEBP) family uncharacterized protein
MTDPDAPTREDPTNGEYCHWIATGLTLELLQRTTVSSGSQAVLGSSSGAQIAGPMKDLLPYRPPGPPKKTGYHRYVLVLLKSASKLPPQQGSGIEKALTPPSDRPRWGNAKPRQGVRQWAAKEGLEVVGANFFFSQNDEQ